MERLGFKENYWVWTTNGEQLSNIRPKINTHALRSQSYIKYKIQFNIIEDMVSDAFVVNVFFGEPQDFDIKEFLNEKAQTFYQLLKK